MIAEVSNNLKVNNKNKIKIWVYSLKRNAISIVFCLFCIFLVVFSKTNLLAAKQGLTLWATTVVPSLFPFFVATELLRNTNVINILGKYLTPIMRPVFGIPGEASFALIMGIISGYPVGAKIVSNFVDEGICTKEEAERMLAFTNNSGPLFIIGTVGISLFGNLKIGILLLITHILSTISVGIIFNIIFHFKHNKKEKFNYNKKQNLQENNYVTLSSIGEVLAKSITSAISTCFLIGGFVVIFSVIISILNESHILEGISSLVSPIFSMLNIPTELVNPFLSGIVELTNGVSLVANTQTVNAFINIVLCAFLLGFGGISVLLQVFSIVSKSGLTIKPYFFGKLLQGCLAAVYTFIGLTFICF